MLKASRLQNVGPLFNPVLEQAELLIMKDINIFRANINERNTVFPLVFDNLHFEMFDFWLS